MLPCPRGNPLPGYGMASGSPVRPPAPAAPDASVERSRERPTLACSREHVLSPASRSTRSRTNQDGRDRSGPPPTDLRRRQPLDRTPARATATATIAVTTARSAAAIHLIRCVISPACRRLPETFRNKVAPSRGLGPGRDRRLSDEALSGRAQLLRDERMTTTCPVRRLASARWFPLATVRLDANHELRRLTGCCSREHGDDATPAPSPRLERSEVHGTESPIRHHDATSRRWSGERMAPDSMVFPWPCARPRWITQSPQFVPARDPPFSGFSAAETASSILPPLRRVAVGVMQVVSREQRFSAVWSPF